MEALEKTADSNISRKTILDFEQEIINSPEKFVPDGEEYFVFKGDSDYCPLEHFFTDGIYTRKITIPAGTILTGKIHFHKHPNFLMKGKVKMFTEFGGFEILEAPLDMISEAGTKRVIQTLTETVWITVHHNPTNTQDLAKLEKIIIADSYETFEKQKRLNDGTIGRLRILAKKIILKITQ